MTAIFDMDGLLLDTEPLWGRSMLKVTESHGIGMKPEYFKFTTGLKIYEVTEFWSHKIPWPKGLDSQQVAQEILIEIISLAKSEGRVMPGVLNVLDYLKSQGVLIGLATSSPVIMIEELIHHFQLNQYFDVMISADTVEMGKPHPAVYLECAKELNVKPWDCIAFEDSINGMIAAKAARMQVVVVPEAQKISDERFGLADLKLKSLKDFKAQDWITLQAG